MSTHILVSGLSFFCTDDELYQAFAPFGTVVFVQVLRDMYGHSLGLGVVYMAHPEDVAQIFSASRLARFEIAGAHVSLWEPTESYGTQRYRTGSPDLKDMGDSRPFRGTEQENGQKSPSPVESLMRHLIHTIVPTRTVGH